ncbi:hypothetical protein STIAU_6351 [Stigmatella aurantiaca DW4/3-1]|uniref:Uncharacterized protein n=1 Tax=Stigmatella aurantiaca (strain DW4/3-1) TaxID=378806 RepID=Q08W15_STIAD|nr:hypothetical protein STIAU_6351 [Stigmatella aurantiaca DW4/3-1]
MQPGNQGPMRAGGLIARGAVWCGWTVTDAEQ